MKKLFLGLVIGLTVVSYGSLFSGLVASNRFNEAASHICWSDTDCVNLGNVELLYNAASSIMNNDGKAVIAHKALQLGNKELFTNWLYQVKLTYNPKTHYWIGLSLSGQAFLDTNKSTSAWININGKWFGKTLNELYPDIMLPFYVSKYNSGDYITAAQSLSFTHRLGKRLSYITSEWSELFESFTVEQIIQVRSSQVYINIKNYYVDIDKKNKDKNYTQLRRFINSDFIRSYSEISDSIYHYNHANLIPPLRIDFMRGLVTYSPSSMIRVKAAKRLDELLKNKESSTGLWSWLIQNGTKAETIDMALYLDDVDKIITSLSSFTDKDLTAEQISKVIVIFNALDISYHKSEVLSILENINSKYTIKLYDDQATWEPIIAKVRAMINVRK